ncbi:hypothetical protein JG687_00017537 [Phytophthora cactorum]|uniref:Uncharacterized protein n=1 Tax=Phytophthora cactorum TaxID=29920 RepID=A0A8T1TS85_9STRA|nr:hypothetical protein JG687_00017537 [Phytophthora cactorum]
MAYSPEDYLRNKERIQAAQKRYYRKTRETRIQKQREYDTKNKYRIKERKKRLYAAKVEKKRVQ